MRRGGYRGGRGSTQQQAIHISLPPLEAVVGRLETISRLLLAVGRHSTRPEEIHAEIRLMYQDLTRVGPHLEATYPDVLDRVMSSMRDASAQPSLPPPLRLAIFQLVELRASHWSLPPDTTNYYTQRSQFHSDDGNELVSENHDPAPSTGLSSDPPPSPGKSFLQEIIIKNSDSGKVMGVRGRRVRLIETLSDTIISFEKVLPSAKERTLFINGHSDNAIQVAKELIEETIERNASPILELDSKNLGNSTFSPLSPTLSPPVDGPEFSYTIQLGQDVIRISGTHLPFVQEGKLALDEHFLRKFPHLFYGPVPSNASLEVDNTISSTGNSNQLEKPKWKYDRRSLLEIEQTLAQRPQLLPTFLSTLDPCIRNSIVLQKRRVVDSGFVNQSLSNKNGGSCH